MNFIFLPHCSCLVNFIIAPAHLHATGVDVYPALLFSRVLRKSTPRFVHWSIRVCKSVVHILLFYESCNMTSLPLPKWPRGLKYGPCPPAHDWSSDVSGLVCFRNDLVWVKTWSIWVSQSLCNKWRGFTISLRMGGQGHPTLIHTPNPTP